VHENLYVTRIFEMKLAYCAMCIKHSV